MFPHRHPGLRRGDGEETLNFQANMLAIRSHTKIFGRIVFSRIAAGLRRDGGEARTRISVRQGRMDKPFSELN
jgi:hypothetical protein